MCANYTDFKKVLEADPVCPMCETNVPPMTVKISEDPASEFKALMALMKEPAGPEDENNEEESSDDAMLWAITWYAKPIWLIIIIIKP